MDSYWHKEEKIPLEGLNIDLSTKADKSADNLTGEDITSWKPDSADLQSVLLISIFTST